MHKILQDVLILKKYRNVVALRCTHAHTSARTPATVSAAQMVKAAAPSHRQREGNSLCRTQTELELEKSSPHQHSLPCFLVSAPGQQTSQG